MNASSPTRRRLVGAFAATAAAAALAAPAALADPPNYSRHVPQSQVAPDRVPEIVAGIAAQPEGRPTPRPEIVSGIASPRGVLLASAPSTHVTARGFDWADAGIGAGIALAGAAFASGCALALRRRVSLAH
jgi:hypothetical protein